MTGEAKTRLISISLSWKIQTQWIHMADYPKARTGGSTDYPLLI